MKVSILAPISDPDTRDRAGAPSGRALRRDRAQGFFLNHPAAATSFPCVPMSPADAVPLPFPPQLNIANPATGQQKKLEITDESKL
jgi:hypothetical protein